MENTPKSLRRWLRLTSGSFNTEAALYQVKKWKSSFAVRLEARPQRKKS